MPYFGNLICFVKECEIIIEKENFPALKTYESMDNIHNTEANAFMIINYNEIF